MYIYECKFDAYMYIMNARKPKLNNDDEDKFEIISNVKGVTN